MISYFQFRETHYCDTARTAGGTSAHGSKGGTGSGSTGTGGGNGGGGNGGGGNGGGGNGGGGTSGSTGGGGRPRPPSVFDQPPPQTVTVAPPGTEPPVKPPRDPVFNGGSFDPFGGLLGGVFGEPTQPTQPTPDYDYVPEAEQEVPIVPQVPIVPESTCPRNCSIIHIPTGIVAVDNRMCSCSTIDRYQQDPNYRVEFTTPEPEPEQMEFLCSDVYTLENGSAVKTTYNTLSVSQIQNFINQGLLIRDCGTPSPSLEQVRSHYGYTADVEPLPEEEPTTVDVLPPDVNIHQNGDPPPQPTPTPTPTTTPTGLANFGIAGILFAGVLALPILAGLGKWK